MIGSLSGKCQGTSHIHYAILPLLYHPSSYGQYPPLHIPFFVMYSIVGISCHFKMMLFEMNRGSYCVQLHVNRWKWVSCVCQITFLIVLLWVNGYTVLFIILDDTCGSVDWNSWWCTVCRLLCMINGNIYIHRCSGVCVSCQLSHHENTTVMKCVWAILCLSVFTSEVT